jgi:hypothetical protein
MAGERFGDVVARKGVPLDERADPRAYHAGGLPTPPGMAPATVQYYPPWIQPPDVYQDFNLQTPLATAVAAGTSIQPASVQYQTPNAYRGVIREVSLFIDAPNPTLDVTFILLIAGAPVPGWSRSSFARTATNISIDFDSHIRFREGQLVSWNIVNNSGVSWTVGVRFSGWIYPSSEETRIMGRLT